jgi:cytoskeletal protein RodZ
VPSFGEELRRERELRRITLREVSEATKINLRYLDALEHNEFRHLPGGVFNKGFVRAYAEFIGADPEAMVNSYLLEHQSQEQRSAARPPEVLRRAEPERAPVEVAAETDGTPSRARRARNKLTLITGLLGLGLAAGAGGLLWHWWKGGPGTTRASLPSAVTGAPQRAGARPTSPPALATVEPPPTTSSPTPGAEAEARDRRAESTRAPASPTEPRARAKRHQPEPGAEQPAPAQPAPGAAADTTSDDRAGAIQARLVLERALSGRLNCDNRRVEVFDGLPPGTVLEVECSRFLALDADDGGGLRLGLGGSSPTPLVADGVPLRDYRVVAGRDAAAQPPRAPS